MKIFKWHLIDNIDKMCLENGEIARLRKIREINEEQLWENHLLIEKLKEENKELKNMLSKKIIEEIGEPIEYRGKDND